MLVHGRLNDYRLGVLIITDYDNLKLFLISKLVRCRSSTELDLLKKYELLSVIEVKLTNPILPPG